jgi:hypothetical protein
MEKHNPKKGGNPGCCGYDADAADCHAFWFL